MNLVFVCTGNTCGSPMAEYMAREVFAQNKLNVNVWSRGTNVFVATGMSANALMAIKEMGFDGSKHVAMQLEIEDIEKADLIIAMTNKQKNAIEGLCNNLGKEVYTIKELTHNSNSDIENPYGGRLVDYEDCAKDIYSCVIKLPEIISNVYKNELR